MDGHTGIIAVSGAGGEGQDMVAALWMNPGLDQGILQQLIKSHSHIREPPVFFLFAGVLGGRFCGVPGGDGTFTFFCISFVSFGRFSDSFYCIRCYFVRIGLLNLQEFLFQGLVGVG